MGGAPPTTSTARRSQRNLAAGNGRKAALYKAAVCNAAACYAGRLAGVDRYGARTAPARLLSSDLPDHLAEALVQDGPHRQAKIALSPHSPVRVRLGRGYVVRSPAMLEMVVSWESASGERVAILGFRLIGSL